MYKKIGLSMSRIRQKPVEWAVKSVLALLLLGSFLYISSNIAFAEGQEQDQYPIPDLACQLCHSDSQREVTFASGERLPVIIDLEVLANSVHGTNQQPDGATCTGCHQPIDDYQQPHAAVEAQDLRSYQIERANNCQLCHTQVHPTSHPGVEAEIAVICTDCHGAHEVTPVAVFQSVEGTSVCVACHEKNQVRTTNSETLFNVIENGFFEAGEKNKEYCLGCHSQPDFTLTFANGDTKTLTVDPASFEASVHGKDNPWQPLDCTNCHEDYLYPHKPIAATSSREYSLEKYPVCRKCHEENYEKTMDSVHEDALENGIIEAAVCTDCHHTHDTPKPDEPRSRISYTCRNCHSTIFDEYSTSVHGEALLNESNPDVPTCIECHGVHNINDPTTAMARARSPRLCATCHNNQELMDKYDISTDVFETYVADFHGTTVTLFEHDDPTIPTNKAVCFDCHGIHNIKKPDDPESGIKNNLLAKCQQCHPDATASFSDSWTSHFRPSLEHNPTVFLIDLFYKLVIPGTVGFFAFLVLTDIYRRIRERFSKETKA